MPPRGATAPRPRKLPTAAAAAPPPAAAAAAAASTRTASAAPALRPWTTPEGSPATPAYFTGVQGDIVGWWVQHRRNDLPWRPGGDDFSRPRADPYEVWVSEVMSQQTRMDTVIRYFPVWMRAFPRVEDVAAASEDDVRRVWAGLGFYRRAMYLRKGAQFIVAQFRAQAQAARRPIVSVDDDEEVAPAVVVVDGEDNEVVVVRDDGGVVNDADGRDEAEAPVEMPRSYTALLRVPGIGPYTAAAIASVCYGEPVAAVDGNVIRVLSRLRAERDVDPKNTRSIKAANEWGQTLMLGGSSGSGVDVQTRKSRKGEAREKGTEGAAVCAFPGALNQGLMELGGAVCRPNGPPLCEQCPLQRHCCAYALHSSGQIPSIDGYIPLRGTKAKMREDVVVCVVHELPPPQSRTTATSSSSSSSVEAAARPSSLSPSSALRTKERAGRKQRQEDSEGEEAPRRYVIVRRPESGLLGGMLEFPSLTIHSRPLDAAPPPPPPFSPAPPRRRGAPAARSDGATSLSSESSGASGSDGDEEEGRREVKGVAVLAGVDEAEKAAVATLATLPATTTTTTTTIASSSSSTGLLPSAPGLVADPPVALGTVRHVFSHINMLLRVYHVRWRRGADETAADANATAATAARGRSSSRTSCGGVSVVPPSAAAAAIVVPGALDSAERDVAVALASALDGGVEEEAGEEGAAGQPSTRERISILSESQLCAGASSSLCLKVLRLVHPHSQNRAAAAAASHRRRQQRSRDGDVAGPPPSRKQARR